MWGGLREESLTDSFHLVAFFTHHCCCQHQILCNFYISHLHLLIWQLFVASQQKFHDEAYKNYWKAIAELIPNEVPAIEKKKAKRDQEKKPSIVVIQGPKPGKPTELSRMRQIIIRLKHNTPAHLKPSPPPASAPATDTKTSDAAAKAGPSQPAAAATPTEVVVAA